MKKTLIVTATIAAMAATSATAFADSHKGKMFDEIDSNKDGAISASEHAAHAKKRFEKMDTDGNGVISKEEAKAHKKAKKEMKKERKPERKAKSADHEAN